MEVLDEMSCLHPLWTMNVHECAQNIMAIHSIVIEIFQAGSSWYSRWTNQDWHDKISDYHHLDSIQLL